MDVADRIGIATGRVWAASVMAAVCKQRVNEYVPRQFPVIQEAQQPDAIRTGRSRWRQGPANECVEWHGRRIRDARRWTRGGVNRSTRCSNDRVVPVRFWPLVNSRKASTLSTLKVLLRP